MLVCGVFCCVDQFKDLNCSYSSVVVKGTVGKNRFAVEELCEQIRYSYWSCVLRSLNSEDVLSYQVFTKELV